MKTRSILALIGVAVLAVGCATPRQSYVELDKSAINGKSGKVGVAMTPLRKPDTRFPGADCLLCMATASLLNASLTSHTQKLPPEGLPAMKVAIDGSNTDQPFRTIRYVEGTAEKMERAQLVSEHCGRLVIKTLRGSLMSVPVKASASTGGNGNGVCEGLAKMHKPERT